ncbi:hypothetical protein H0H93_007560 [Arthromyces matolae]|nr:hypothetical protein H0H93_007560 [Arthromyces matolae]
MPFSKSIAPFAVRSPPPPPLIVLVASTDLVRERPAPALAHCDLPDWRPRQKGCRFEPYPREKTPQPGSPAPLANPKAPTAPAIDTRTGLDNENERDTSPLPSLTPSLPSSRASSCAPDPSPSLKKKQVSFASAVNVDKHRISRPTGAGRKELANLVKWETTVMSNIKDHTRKLINIHLQPDVSFKAQKADAIKRVKQLIIDEFPIIDNYEDAWPVDHLLISTLKYLSSRQKDISARKILEAVKGTKSKQSQPCTA